MIKHKLALLWALGTGFAFSAIASETLVKFSGGIGVQPVSSVSGTATNPPTNSIFPEVTRNIVRSVNPAGQIWVIKSLKASVGFDGHIKVRGKGLLLGGGNNIGLNAGASVNATLICEAAAPFTLHSTLTGVPLAPDGDFRIDDVLVPPVPAVCASPVLLIRNAANGGWFAAGIQDPGGDHDD